MKVLIVVLCGVLSIGSIALAQLKVDVSLVNVVATVTDDRGRYVPNLTADDFVLEEDGQVQKIAHISYSEDTPISLGIVLDTSGSMERKISTATSAVEKFIRTIHKEDDIFLMTFSEWVTLAQDFTDDRARLTSALRRVQVRGGTALYDALDEGLHHLKDGMHGKKAILLLTDGVDENSRLTFERAQQAVRESEFIVYCLGIAPSSGPLSEGGPVTIPRPGTGPGTTNPGGTGIPGGPPGSPSTSPTIRLPGGITIPIPSRRFNLALQRPQNPQGGNTSRASGSVDMNVLNVFANASGGKAWLVGGMVGDVRGNDFDKIFDELAEELRSQYNIGYYPNHAMDDNKWHRVEVRAKNSHYHVRARKDYFGS